MPKFINSAPQKNPGLTLSNPPPHKQYLIATWVAQQSSIELELNFLNKIIAWEAFIWTCAWQFLYQLRVVAQLYLNKNTREKWT